MIEEWRDIEGFEGYYQVSNLGRVKSLSRITKSKPGYYRFTYKRILKSYVSTNGYKMVSLRKESKTHYRTVHRLVTKAFIPNPENKGDVNHIDANRLNNKVENLEWATRSENIKHCIKLGRNKTPNKGKTGKDCIFSKRVKQYSIDNEFLAEFESITKAREVTGVNNISKACKSKTRFAGGFIWKYADIQETTV